MFGEKKFKLINTSGKGSYLFPQMWKWILPPWFINQNNPLHPDYCAGITDFYNYTRRSWTTLRADGSKIPLRVDDYGIIYLTAPRLSMEVWLYHGQKLYTPGIYPEISQRFSLTNGGIDTVYRLNNGFLSMTVGPEHLPSQSQIGIKLSVKVKSVNFFEPIIIALIIRPFDDNGLAPIYSMEYKEKMLIINGRKVLSFMEEPAHSFFSNAHQGDVAQYFRYWEGNTGIRDQDGCCTGMLGFSNIPSKMRPVKLMVFNPDNCPQAKLNRNSWVKSLGRPDSFLKMLNTINTGTGIDPIYKANIRHLATHCIPEAADPYLILVLNRFGLTEKSRWYLQKSLQKIGWDGSLGDRLSGLNLIFVLADYYKISRDLELIENYWPYLKRIGFWLCHQTFMESIPHNKKFDKDGFCQGRFERCLWICASLSALAELGNILNKNSEIQVFKNYFLFLWTKTQYLFLNINDNSPDDGLQQLNHYGVKELVEMLAAAFPFQLMERGNPATLGRIARIMKNYLYQGGIFSPREFKGVNLELTARLCQVIIREGWEYGDILKYLLSAASPAWTWPDRIHPLSKKGIGVNGHDPRVLYQTLLMIRSLFVIEEYDQLQLLPGIFCSDFWSCPNIELHDFPTTFGRITLKTQTIGKIIQVKVAANFLHKPQKIILVINQKYRVVFADTCITIKDGVITAGPDLGLIRLRRCMA